MRRARLGIEPNGGLAKLRRVVEFFKLVSNARHHVVGPSIVRVRLVSRFCEIAGSFPVAVLYKRLDFRFDRVSARYRPEQQQVDSHRLLIAERDGGVYIGGPPGGKITGDQRDG